jgi:hypothetical protein
VRNCGFIFTMDKILCFDVSPGANTKKAIQATLAVFGVVFVNTLLGMAANGEGINMAAAQPGGLVQLLPFLFLFVVVLGGCLSAPLLCAYQAVNKRSNFCHQVWSCCFGCAAFFGLLSILTAVMTSESDYKMYCPELCQEQFNNGSSYCTTVATGWGGEPTPSKVPKEYCDSKGTTFHGSWYTLYVSQVFNVVVALLHIAGTYYICNSKTELESNNNGVVQMSVANPQQQMSYAQQPQIVTAVVVMQPAPGPVVTIVKQ